MSSDTLPPVPVSSNPADLEPPVRLGRLLAGLVLSIAAFDACFWQIHGLGFSLAIFAVVLGGVIFWNREAGRGLRSILILSLLAVAAVASMLEVGWCNVLVLLGLVTALAGDSYFRSIASFWGRIISQVFAQVLAPGRIFWLGRRLVELVFGRGFGGVGTAIGGIVLALPALVLALGFGWLLAQGNAVVGTWTGSFFDWLEKELELYFDLGRIFLWGFVALLVLPLLRPSRLAGKWWSPGEWFGRLPEIVPTRGAVFSSGLVLLVLNLLFGVANIADLLFLWSGQSLPKGVTYSGFVHSGTNALTWTVLLSAIVLTVIFQQSLQVTRRKELKALAMVWIAQNLFLILSVALRLKLYIEAYDMTELRLGVIIFLVLVMAGYVLLAIKILRDRSLAWLIGGCTLAAFATLYITQFLDLGGWSANYNVARWEKDRTRHLDVHYLYELGPAAWPALEKANKMDSNISVMNPDSSDTWSPFGDSYLFDSFNWREFSLRAYWNRWALDDKK
jgi:hypothetical protein